MKLNNSVENYEKILDCNKIEKGYKNSILKKLEKIPSAYQKICIDYLEKQTYNRDNVSTKYTQFDEDIKQKLIDGVYKRPSDIFKGENKVILDVFIDKDMQEMYLYLVDKLNQFPIEIEPYEKRGTIVEESKYQTPVRSKSYVYYMSKIIDIMFDISRFNNLGYKLDDVLTNKVSVKKSDIDYIFMYISLEDLIAGYLDFEDSDIENAIKEVFKDKNKINRIKNISKEIIDYDEYMFNDSNIEDRLIYKIQEGIFKGIIKSDNAKMYKVLEDFLINNQIENQFLANCIFYGVPKAFIYSLTRMLDSTDSSKMKSLWPFVLLESYLNTRIKNIYYTTYEKIELMIKALTNKNCSEQFLKSDDSTKFYLGLWSIGYYDLDCALEYIEKIIEQNDIDKLEPISYYLDSIGIYEIAFNYAKKVILKNQENLKLIALYMPFFIKVFRKKIKNSDRIEECEIFLENQKNISLYDFFTTKEEAKHIFSIFHDISDFLHKEKLIEYLVSHEDKFIIDPYYRDSEFIRISDKFPYGYIELNKTDIEYILLNLCLILSTEPYCHPRFWLPMLPGKSLEEMTKEEIENYRKILLSFALDPSKKKEEGNLFFEDFVALEIHGDPRVVFRGPNFKERKKTEEEKEEMKILLEERIKKIDLIKEKYPIQIFKEFTVRKYEKYEAIKKVDDWYETKREKIEQKYLARK